MSRYALPSLPALFVDGARDFDKGLLTGLSSWATLLGGILDRGITLADNVDCDIVSFTTNATPDAETTVAHALGKVPTYFIVADLDKGGVVYKGATAFTSTNVYLKCTVASAAVKLILL